MLYAVTVLMFIFMIVPATFGLLVFYHVFVRRKKEPADKSNRINHLRLVWFAMTREEDFVDLYDWLKYDEKENMNR